MRGRRGCNFLAEYAAKNKVDHPKSVYLLARTYRGAQRGDRR
jgi:hypothetical protein